MTLNTDVAETSASIPDTGHVVDTGVAKIKVNQSFELCWASRAPLVQMVLTVCNLDLDLGKEDDDECNSGEADGEHSACRRGTGEEA